MKLLLLFPSPSDCVVSFACCMRVPFKTVGGGGDLLQDPVNGSHLRRKYSYELIGLWVLKSFAFALGGTTSGHELTIPLTAFLPHCIFFWLAICDVALVAYGNLHGTWNMAKTETEACSSGSRTNATRQRNCVISRGVACGSNIISICKWRIFTTTPLPRQFVTAYIHKHSHTLTRTLDTLVKFVAPALWRLLFQLINMFVSINRNYANYRWMCFWAPSLACKLHATELSLTCNSMLQAFICICICVRVRACYKHIRCAFRGNQPNHRRMQESLHAFMLRLVWMRIYTSVCGCG